MLRSCWRYLRRQVLPRWLTILTGSELWAAIGLSVAFGLYGQRLGLGRAKVGDVATAALAYAAVAFGFSLAGLTLALTLPDQTFAKELATTGKAAPKGRIGTAMRRLEPKNSNAYSELLFVFSWTAIAHWLTVVASFAFLIRDGFDETLMPSGAGALHRAAVALWSFVAIYAVTLFLLTLVTLSQVGQTYITELRKRP